MKGGFVVHNDDWKWYLLVAVVVIVLVFPLIRDLFTPNANAYNADKVPAYVRDYIDYYEGDEHSNAWRAGYVQGFEDAVDAVGDWMIARDYDFPDTYRDLLNWLKTQE